MEPLPAHCRYTCPISALSIKQPWANCILYGTKRHENRSRRTNFRGWCCIHASKKADWDAWADLSSEIPEGHPIWENPPHNGHIIGFMRIDGCVEYEVRKRLDFPIPGWFCGPFGWVIGAVKPLPRPIPASGAMGFWDITYPERKITKTDYEEIREQFVDVLDAEIPW